MVMRTRVHNKKYKRLTRRPATVTRLIKLGEIITELAVGLDQAVLQSGIGGRGKASNGLFEMLLKTTENGVSARQHWLLRC